MFKTRLAAEVLEWPFPRPFPLTMASQKGVGTPPPSLTIIGEDPSNPDPNLHDTPTPTKEVYQYPVRISIRTRNRDQNVSPQAVFKSFLTELSLHDPTAKIGAHDEIFYTLESFPTDPKDFNDAFHGKAQEGEHPKIKPFYTEYVGNGPSICTWFTISSMLDLRLLHTKLNA